MAKKRFQAEVADMGRAVAVDIPDDVLAALGGKRVPVKVTVNRYTFATTTAVMGGRQLIGFSKVNREGAGITAGETVTVTIENDTEPRVIEPPTELAAAFRRSAAARKTWEALSYTHQREYAEWITGAKRDETRRDRAAKAIAALKDGRKSPDDVFPSQRRRLVGLAP